MDSNKNNNKKQTKIFYAIAGVTALILISIIISCIIVKNNKNEENKNIAYTELIKYMDEGKIEKIEMTVGSTTAKVKLKDQEEEKKAILPNTQAFIELLQDKISEGKQIELIQNPQSALVRTSSTLFSMLPTIMLLVMIILIFKLQGIGEKGKVYNPEENNTNVTFKDVAGLDEEKEELIEIVDFLKKPKNFMKWVQKYQEEFYCMVNQEQEKH